MYWLKAFSKSSHKGVFLGAWIKQVWRYGLKNLLSDRAIVICQFGKVGSSSILDSLTSMGLGMPIYHTHGVSSYDVNRIEFQVGRAKDPKRKVEKIVQRMYLRAVLDKRFSRYYFITLVREPVAVLVSAFFQLEGKKLWEDYSSGRRTLSEIKEHFLKWQEWYRDWFDGWFDKELLPYLGAEVFDSAFPTERGYDIYTYDKVKLIILRLEDLDRCHGQAFSEFLELKTFSLTSANVGKEKPYGDAYRQFVEHAAFPDAFLDKVYGLRYARHFYSDEERATYRARWSEV